MSGIYHLLCFLILLIFANIALAQSGTYQKRDRNGALCNIAVNKKGRLVEVAAFAWWGTPSGTNGNFSGVGVLKSGVSTIKSAEDAGCSLNLTLGKESIRAVFNDCIASNLPGDFSGTYHLMTTALPGAYMINDNRSYFHKIASAKSKSNAYLVKGNKVEIILENIHNREWVFVYYRNSAGRETSGYMSMATLKLLKQSL